jgi:hypothetical protein
VLEVERCWGNRAASSEENGLCFVNIDLKFSSGKITKQYGRCMGEPSVLVMVYIATLSILFVAYTV